MAECLSRSSGAQPRHGRHARVSDAQLGRGQRCVDVSQHDWTILRHQPTSVRYELRLRVRLAGLVDNAGNRHGMEKRLMEPVKVHETREWTIHPWNCQPLRGEVSGMRYQVSGFMLDAGCLSSL
jgi:hypothetical protein